METKEEYYDWKIRKLRMIIDLCAPDDATHKDEIYAPGAISAIAEMNKMQGHYMKCEYERDKDEELNVISSMLKELKTKNEKDY